MTTRIGLYALLPVIALAVYLDGQRYDPSSANFMAEKGSALAAYLPATIDGMTRDGQPRLFSKDNLFELVNGHAEFFISGGFKEVAVAGYKSDGEQNSMPVINVDVYDMGSPENAFGVMAEEGAEGAAFDAGFMGVKTGESILFIKGPYYVKIAAFGNGVAKLVSCAKALDATMAQITSSLPQFNRLPDSGSTGKNYVRKDYLGMEFFTGVFEKKYERGGVEFTGFVMTPKDGAEALMAQAIVFYKESGATITPLEAGELKGWDIVDKYEGPMALAVSGPDVIGIKGMEDAKSRGAFILETVETPKK